MNINHTFDHTQMDTFLPRTRSELRKVASLNHESTSTVYNHRPLSALNGPKTNPAKILGDKLKPNELPKTTNQTSEQQQVVMKRRNKKPESTVIGPKKTAKTLTSLTSKGGLLDVPSVASNLIPAPNVSQLSKRVTFRAGSAKNISSPRFLKKTAKETLLTPENKFQDSSENESFSFEAPNVSKSRRRVSFKTRSKKLQTPMVLRKKTVKKQTLLTPEDGLQASSSYDSLPVDGRRVFFKTPSNKQVSLQDNQCNATEASSSTMKTPAKSSKNLRPKKTPKISVTTSKTASSVKKRLSKGRLSIYGRMDKDNSSVQEMVYTVLKDNNVGPKGLSLYAIKKFMVMKYGVTMKQYAERVRNCLIRGVDEQRLVRVSGYGVNGSFKINPAGVAFKPVEGNEELVQPNRIVKKKAIASSTISEPSGVALKPVRGNNELVQPNKIVKKSAIASSTISKPAGVGIKPVRGKKEPVQPTKIVEKKAIASSTISKPAGVGIKPVRGKNEPVQPTKIVKKKATASSTISEPSPD